MNNDLFIDGVRVFRQNWALILEILICISWGALLVFATLKKTAKQGFTDTELAALALGGWPLPALFISLPVLILLPALPAYIIFILAATLITIGTGVAIHSLWKDITLGVFLPFIIFLILFFWRLGFIANAILPPYFDSAEHYRIIQLLLRTEWPTSSYYHLGYHIIIAALKTITHADLSQAMLIFGQAILAAIPLPVYFFIRRVTASNKAAFFGVTLAALGWYMPAHAVNWGKYPALLSLLLIQFTLGAVILKNRWLTILSIIASVLIHTRAAILFGMLGAAWMLSDQVWNKRALLLALAGTMLGVTILSMNQNQFLGPIFEPYWMWITLPVVLLSALTFQSFPKLTIFSSLAILMSLAGIFIPVTSSITLLDRPLVEIILFLPLSFLGGLGASRLPKFAVPVFAAVVILHAWISYNFYPSDCCQLADRNDAAALDWINKRAPADAHFAIASADLRLNAFGTPMQSAGTDAGIWIAPLTQRATLPLTYLTDFTTQSTHDLLCDQQVTHIYIGAMPQSFNLVETNPEWYETIFVLSKTQIVQVTGCGDG
ncbi:MAG: hypothetical protein HY863_03000 [Chloroflexi bacterium]|nr:hypothetical protein [Chloroflexota bacterium]